MAWHAQSSSMAITCREGERLNNTKTVGLCNEIQNPICFHKQRPDVPYSCRGHIFNYSSYKVVSRRKQVRIFTFSTFLTTLSAFRAANPPIETWSSVPALVERESTLAGWQRVLFSDTEVKVQKSYFCWTFLLLLISIFTQRCGCAVCYHKTRV